MLPRFSRFVALAMSGALFLAIAVPVVAAETSRVRVLHASPDAPNVDVYLDDAKVDALTDVAFKTISAYLSIPAGTHNVKAVIDTDVTFASGQRYTVAATDVVASIVAHVIEDDPAPSSSGAQLRVVHFSADAPAVDVRPDGGSPIVTALAYPDATGYLDIPAGTYDLEVCAAGSDTCPLDLDPVAAEGGTSYSAFAVGSLTGGSLAAVLAVDAVAAPSSDTVDVVASSDASALSPALVAIATLAAIGFAIGCRRFGQRTDR
jgi:hypothetical protein